MHLVYKALEKYAIPSVLPPELMPPGKRKETVMPIARSPVPQQMVAPPPIPPLPNVPAANSLIGLEPAKVISSNCEKFHESGTKSTGIRVLYGSPKAGSEQSYKTLDYSTF